MTAPDLLRVPESEDTDRRARIPDKRRKRRRVAIIVWSIVAVLIVGGALAAWWLVTSALQVRNDLEAARAEVTNFESALRERRLDELQPISERLAASAESAAAPTSNPVWRAAEWVPVVGENLRAVRIVAVGVDDISREIVTPTVELTSDFGLGRDATTGGFDVTPLREASAIVADAERVIGDFSAEVATIDTDATIPQVSDAVTQIDEVLASAGDTVAQVNGALAGVGALLGLDGEREVVLAFQNNAEVNPLGGGTAAQTLLRVNDGAVAIERQVSSADFAIRTPVDVAVDDSTFQLYNDILLNEPNATTSPPDFPTAAKLISAHWQRNLGITPDVVVAVDPIALSRILRVTGPVTMPNGEELTADNVVSKMLNEVYFRYPDGGPESDAYFAGAAAAVFDRLMSADYEVFDMMQALVDAANNGSVMMWSSDEATQKLFDGTRLQGTLPAGNDGATVLGVYFRDRTVSKIDYYLHTEAIVTTNTCTPDAPTYTVETRLRFDAPDDLPRYIVGDFYDYYLTEVFLYGPVGGQTIGSEVVDGGLGAATGPTVTDFNRPAVKFTLRQESGQTTVVRATFSGTPDDGPVEVRTTPMINATAVTVNEAPCG